MHLRQDYGAQVGIGIAFDSERKWVERASRLLFGRYETGPTVRYAFVQAAWKMVSSSPFAGAVESAVWNSRPVATWNCPA
jgi:hypothetical protein